MNSHLLRETAARLVCSGKGLLAIDESTPTCNLRFESVGVPKTLEYRRAYREMILTTPNLGENLSGIILYDETIRESATSGASFLRLIQNAGIIPGIKVDIGAKPLAGFSEEKVTEGLDGLRGRLAEYFEMGARFTKWRAVIQIGDGIPTRGCIEANAHALARFAALSQEAGMVPIVEAEILMDGDHTIERCFEVTTGVLKTVFNELYLQRVELDGMILKPSMVAPGLACVLQSNSDEVAELSVKCFLECVPAAVPGIAFLSGGQSPQMATSRLNAMNLKFKARTPWSLTFSFARAIQQPALEIWRGQEARVKQAQNALQFRAMCNRAASRGQYDASIETIETTYDARELS